MIVSEYYLIWLDVHLTKELIWTLKTTIIVKKISIIANTCTVNLGFNEDAWDCLILLIITVIRYKSQDLCAKLTILDQKF